VGIEGIKAINSDFACIFAGFEKKIEVTAMKSVE